MSEMSALLSSSEASTHSLLPHIKSRVSLLDFPPTATFHIWRKALRGTEPVDGGKLHISELIHGDGDHVLVVFATMATDDWGAIKRELGTGDQSGLKPILVGSVNRTHIASALWGAEQATRLHGLTCHPSHPTVFVPSEMLMKILGIERGFRTRNALVLIRDGHIVATWVSGGDEGNRPHDWTTILSRVG